MRNAYLVTSAINTKFGVFDANVRFLQTLDTYKSIKARDPNAILIHIEMAALPLSNLQKDVIASVTDFQFDFTSDQQVSTLYNSTDNWDIVKNVNEVMCFGKALEMVKDLDLPVSRYFKVSGRYTLTNNFDPTAHSGNKYTFAKHRPSQFSPIITSNCVKQYMSRCWSFPANSLNEVKRFYSDALTFMLERLQNNGYVDIEHCLYRFFKDKDVTELDKIGVAGQIGPTGSTVED